MDDLKKFKLKLPEMRHWIDETLDKYKICNIKVSSLQFSKLSTVLPMDILNKAKVVLIDGPVPVPPLSSEMGLTKLAELENRNLDGITYKDTFFINAHYHNSEGLFFHELVHVVQWDKLGVDNFLLAYGAGILKHGYRDCPLEKMAYSLQDDFKSDILSGYVDDSIRDKTTIIWDEVLQLITADPV